MANDIQQLKIDRSPQPARSRRSGKRWWWLAGSVVVAALLAVGVSQQAPTVQTASVAQAYPSQAITALNATGYVVAQRKASIASKATGRLEWLGDRLRETGDEPIWLVMHHPPFAVGIPSMDQYSLRNPETFWSVIAPHRARIRHLLFGHLHRPIGGSWHGIPFSCTSSPNHQIALDLATLRGDEVPGCREPAGYSVILIDREHVVVHHQQLAGGETRFWL